MKLTKAHLGKEVRVIWNDPGSCTIRDCPPESVPKGLGALARWRERGLLDDITDGVARIVHSDTTRDVGGQTETAPTWMVTYVHEALIESITILEEQAPVAEVKA